VARQLLKMPIEFILHFSVISQLLLSKPKHKVPNVWILGSAIRGLRFASRNACAVDAATDGAGNEVLWG
jgi:hypothetical protein